jgi:putative aldouronate transport system substrate-binding protein
MKKRSIIGFLSLLMVIIMVLGACSGKSKTNQDQYDNPTNASSSNENEKQTNDTDKDVSSTSDRGSLWFDEELVITILLPDNASQPITNFAPAQQEIYNKTNVKLEYQVVPSSSYTEKQSVLLATNNFPDIIKVDTSDIMDYAEDEIFVNLTSYLNKEKMPNFYSLWEQYGTRTRKYLLDGELFVFPVIQRDEARNGFGPVIRTDLMEANNLPIPNTFSELVDTLVKLKEIYPDSIPYTGAQEIAEIYNTADARYQ